jgi:hypothetical protein
VAAGDPYKRLLAVREAMVVEPWSDMEGAPMGSEFLESRGLVDPETDAFHRDAALKCLANILGDEERAEVFVLALDGLLADKPKTDVLRRRTGILASGFTKLLNTPKRK